MTDLHIEFDVLEGLDGPLRAAAAGIDDLAPSVPTGVDAGVMTSVVTAILAEVVESAGSISLALSASADVSDTACAYYRRADADAAASMDQLLQAMGR